MNLNLYQDSGIIVIEKKEWLRRAQLEHYLKYDTCGYWSLLGFL